MKKHVNKNRSFDRLSYIMYDKKARNAMVDYLTNNNYVDIISYSHNLSCICSKLRKQ